MVDYTIQDQKGVATAGNIVRQGVFLNLNSGLTGLVSLLERTIPKLRDGTQAYFESELLKVLQRRDVLYDGDGSETAAKICENYDRLISKELQRPADERVVRPIAWGKIATTLLTPIYQPNDADHPVDHPSFYLIEKLLEIEQRHVLKFPIPNAIRKQYVQEPELDQGLYDMMEELSRGTAADESSVEIWIGDVLSYADFNDPKTREKFVGRMYQHCAALIPDNPIFGEAGGITVIQKQLEEVLIEEGAVARFRIVTKQGKSYYEAVLEPELKDYSEPISHDELPALGDKKGAGRFGGKVRALATLGAIKLGAGELPKTICDGLVDESKAILTGQKRACRIMFYQSRGGISPKAEPICY